MISLPQNGLYAVTDCKNLTTEELVTKTEQILEAGAVILQYRNKDDNISAKLPQAKALQELCNKYHVPFIINDDIELAHNINADGVHLGENDIGCDDARKILGTKKIIGISCYNDLKQAITAENMGATYVAFGAFYSTQTKENATSAKPVLIPDAKKILKLPVVAIGGITPENGKILVAAGANFLAVTSGIYSPRDSATAANAYVKLFRNN